MGWDIGAWLCWRDLDESSVEVDVEWWMNGWW